MPVEKKSFQLDGKLVTLIISDFDADVSTDNLLRTDVANILGEILTFPLVINRLGLMLADIDDMLRRQNLVVETKMDDLKAAQAEGFQKAMKYFQDQGIKSPTVVQCEGEARNYASVKEAQDLVRKAKFDSIDLQKDRDYVNSLYWSAKLKADYLKVMSDKLRPSEFEGEIIEGTINSVQILKSEALFKRNYKD
jgi:hypothetical protein